jgi:hypothetical protein
MATKDRTGEQCPFCGKGKLYPTGGRLVKEPAIAPETGEFRRETTVYECDTCHKTTEAHGIVLGEVEHATFSVDVGKKE